VNETDKESKGFQKKSQRSEDEKEADKIKTAIMKPKNEMPTR